MENRQIDIIQATLNALEQQNDNSILPRPNLASDAPAIDYLHAGVPQPKERVQAAAQGR